MANSSWESIKQLLCAIICLLAICLPAICFAEFNGNINDGDSSQAVVDIQKKLLALGYNLDNCDGLYDTRTKQAVITFQKHAGLEPNGSVDELTWRYLMEPVSRGSRNIAKSRVSTDNRIVQTAFKYKGVPYVFGGQSPQAFDCSGFVQYVFRELGKELPRTADYQFAVGKVIAKSDLQLGDVVFFTTYEPGASHDGIYIGNGQFIAATVSRGVAVCDLGDTFWLERYLGARRYF